MPRMVTQGRALSGDWAASVSLEIATPAAATPARPRFNAARREHDGPLTDCCRILAWAGLDILALKSRKRAASTTAAVRKVASSRSDYSNALARTRRMDRPVFGRGSDRVGSGRTVTSGPLGAFTA